MKLNVTIRARQLGIVLEQVMSARLRSDYVKWRRILMWRRRHSKGCGLDGRSIKPLPQLVDLAEAVGVNTLRIVELRQSGQ